MPGSIQRGALAGLDEATAVITADVTIRLVAQVRGALQILLAAMRPPGDQVYEDLLMVMLRLIFALCAEDRGLLPILHPVYAEQYSVSGLFVSLEAEVDGEALDRRFVAWPRLIALFDALHSGLESGTLSILPHGGYLFDPGQHTFPEGVSDGIVHRVLRLLRIVDGQRLCYGALGEELLGSVYEGLMGHRIGPDRLSIEPGEQRRRTSSHYTPRSLSGPIVRRALEPLLAAIRARIARGQPGLADPQPRAEDLLGLKICDPAMGCGAFLMEACRFMASELVAAWVREGSLARELAAAGPCEAPESLARRIVAARCLIGVDKNPLAVELGKLSLWLLGASRGRPFTVLDHCLKVGDSLVGLTRAQISSLDWREAAGQSTHIAPGRMRDIGDVLLSSYFFPHDHPEALHERALVGGERVLDRDRRACLARIREGLKLWSGRGDLQPLPEGLEIRRALIRAHIRPMHWEIEFPGVFMDAVVGNPPFMGGKSVSTHFGTSYSEWLGRVYHSNASADIAALFFRRARGLLGARGTIGLIATNTIAQGDTRAAGLQALLRSGCEIYDARTNLRWPVRGANVRVSVVHLAVGLAAQTIDRRLDGALVDAIDSQLRPRVARLEPAPLRANRRRSFVGSYVLGKGFVLTPAARAALVHADPRNAERIFPYLGGEALNASPTQSPNRHVINFGDLGLDAAGEWPALLDILRARVKPERDRVNRKALRERWWQYADRRPGLYQAIGALDRCLVCSRVSKYNVFAFQPTDRVFSEQIIVFPLQGHAHFGLLQSRIHEVWVRVHSSTLEDRLRYAPSDCFETFGFPEEGLFAAGGRLEAIGEQLYAARAAYMLATDQGLTRTYNALTDSSNRDPEVVHLRGLHEQLDRVVLDAYGRPDVAVPPYCGGADESLAQFHEQVLELLFARNAELAGREAAARA